MFYCFSVCSELMYWVAVLFIRLCAKSRFEVLWVQNVLSYLGFIFGKMRSTLFYTGVLSSGLSLYARDGAFDYISVAMLGAKCVYY